MSRNNALIVLPALTAACGLRGGFVLTRKFIAGAAEYARYWDGPVIVALQPAQRSQGNLDEVEVQPDHVPFELRWIDPHDRLELDHLCDEAELVLATLVDKHTDLPDVCRRAGIPLVYIAEYSAQTRRQIVRAETANRILRWRRERWTLRMEQRYREALRRASGVQCNGTPTFDAYRSINPRAFLYFDTRVRADQIASDFVLHQRFDELLNGAPLRLGFSGRLIRMKGVDHLPRVAMELKRRGVPFTLDVFGGGELESQLRHDFDRLRLNTHIRLRGVVDFERELLPYVARHVDLFVCCHPQGDPSCTYLETLACGTPIAGYDNEAFRGIIRHCRAGWLTPIDHPQQLAGQIEALHRDRRALVQAAWASLEFASQHTFESVMQRRIDHMRRCAQSCCTREEAVA